MIRFTQSQGAADRSGTKPRGALAAAYRILFCLRPKGNKAEIQRPATIFLN